MANPVAVKIVGNALNTRGFTGDDAISGFGLNTFGFLWPISDIWSPVNPTVTTTWVECDNCTDGCE